MRVSVLSKTRQVVTRRGSGAERCAAGFPGWVSGRRRCGDQVPDVADGVVEGFDGEPVVVDEAPPQPRPVAGGSESGRPGLTVPEAEDVDAGVADRPQVVLIEQFVEEHQVGQVVDPVVRLAVERVGAGVEFLGDLVADRQTGHRCRGGEPQRVQRCGSCENELHLRLNSIEHDFRVSGYVSPGTLRSRRRPFWRIHDGERQPHRYLPNEEFRNFHHNQDELLQHSG